MRKTSIELVKGDITSLNVDAIVNAANSKLQLGLGVAGAIRKNGGPSIQEECDIIAKKNEVPVGQAAITSAGNLKASFVIHAVGPFGSDPNRKDLLNKAISNSIKLAVGKNITSLGIPAIATGIYGYPMKEASEVILKVCSELTKHPLNFRENNYLSL